VRTFTLTRAGEPIAVPEPDLRVPPDRDGRIEPLAAHARSFLDAFRSGSAFTPSFTEGLHAQRLVEAARAVAWRG
jgi:predicted dehydrogenase